MTKETSPITVTASNQFFLSTPSSTYSFHVDTETKELLHDHYGGTSPETLTAPGQSTQGQSGALAIATREFPDVGRGDFRTPAIHIRQDNGNTVSQFTFSHHEIVPGKPRLDGLPSTWGTDSEVTTLKIHLEDKVTQLKVVLSYGVFHDLDAVTRSWTIENCSEKPVVIERAESWSCDLQVVDEGLDMVQLCGDWAREGNRLRRSVEYGTQGFQSSAGYSSHFHNPFVALCPKSTTESTGPAWGFNLVYTGSHSTTIEKFSQGLTRVLLGLNPIHLSYPLAPGAKFTTPECVAVYSAHGVGGMSRILHNLYRHHLSKSKYTLETRPALLNNWEATYFDFDAEKLLPIAKTASDLGVKLFVMDDGWFGKKYPRTSDQSGLGDWVVNPDRFPDGLGAFVKKVTALGQGMKFGLWVEPEMVNPKSALYDEHPDWVLHAAHRARTLQRNQLILNLSLTKVQDYLIESLSAIFSSADISYVKWDNNRSMGELTHPSVAYDYMIGLYRVLDTLTRNFPDILFEGCASGGGRFDPGILHYFPQTWTSDNNDGLERLHIQFGTTLAYPPSSMGCHVSEVPGHQMYRTSPLQFRAHVAMMGGSFGFELDLNKLPAEEREAIPALVKLSEKVNPFVIHGDLYRLALPEMSNWPAAQYLHKGSAVLLAYQIRSTIKQAVPPFKLLDLEAGAKYDVDGQTYSGSTLMNMGLKLAWQGDYDSQVIFITKL